ncbi:MAG TPA: head decoration protein [Candidatus Ozemobacteraceae bacterium]|nr:head decoration protein [Candidatus Ozemobacteraceae bacterium]
MSGLLGTSEATLDLKTLTCGHPPILVKRTLAADATARAAGTVMGIVTNTGYYAPYGDTANDGTQAAKAVLAEDIDAHGSDTVEALLLVHGDVNEEALVGIDDNGAADLFAVGIFVK